DRARVRLDDPRRPHRAGDAAAVTARERELRAHRTVDVGRAQLRLRRYDVGLFASEETGHVHGVRADVHRRAAAEAVLVAEVGELGGGQAGPGLDTRKSSGPAAVDDLAHGVRERVIAVVERLHDNEARTLRDRRDFLGLLRVGRERLLA